MEAAATFVAVALVRRPDPLLRLFQRILWASSAAWKPRSVTARNAAYVLGTLGLLLNGSALAYGLQKHFGVPWQLTVGVLAADIVLFAPLAVVLWRRSRHRHS